MLRYLFAKSIMQVMTRKCLVFMERRGYSMAQGSWSTSTTKGITTATYTVGGKALAKITGLSGTVAAKSSLIDGITVTDGSNGNPGTIHLTGKVLGANTVKLTLSNGGSYNLAIDSSVTAPVTSKGSWSKVKSGASTLTGSITTAGYALSTDGKTLSYLPVGENKTLAKISGIAALDEDVVNAALTVDATRDSNGNATITVSSDALTTTNSKGEEVFVGKNVTLSGTGGYVLALDGVNAPGIGEGLSWSVSGTTATLKGKTTAGYAVTSGTTITYVKEANVTLATVKGLKKGLVAYNDGTDTWVGEKQYDEETGKVKVDANNKVEPSADLKFDDETGVITLNNNVLTSSNVTLTPATGYNYTLALYEAAEDAEEDELAKEVATEAAYKPFWNVNKDNAILYKGTAEYYVSSDDKLTINYYPEVGVDGGAVKVATVTGLNTSGITVDDDGAIEGIDVKINPNGKGGSVTINSESVLNQKNVLLTKESDNSFTLGAASSLYDGHNITVWDVSSSSADLYSYTAAKYTPASTTGINTLLTYKEKQSNSKDPLATVTGLKGDLKENADGSVDGITVGAYIGDGEETEYNDHVIELDKSVLNAQDVEITNLARDIKLEDQNAYSLSLADNVQKSTGTRIWTAGTAKVNKVTVGVATYTEKMSKGYSTEEFDPDTGTQSISYSKGGTVTTKITGLSTDVSVSGDGNGNSIDGINVDRKNGVITLDSDAPLGNTNITIDKNYTLALDDSVKPFESEVNTWAIPRKGTVTATGSVEEDGFIASEDGKTIYYMAKTDDEDVVLATITGLDTANIKVSDVDETTGKNTIDGLAVKSGTNVIVLSDNALGTSKVAVAGNARYTLALGSDVATKDDEDSWKDKTEWVTNKTTATYKTYNKAYYTLDAKGTTVAYTKPTTGTTLATVAGIKSGVDITECVNNNSNTITLGADQLGTGTVTLKNVKNTAFKLAIDSDVATKENTSMWQGITEWATSGTTATLKEYNKAYYTKASDTSITYTKAGGTIKTFATVSGIKSGVEIDDCVDGKTIKLGLDQLAGKKVTLKNGTNETYKLAFADDMPEYGYEDKDNNAASDEDDEKTYDTNVIATAETTEWSRSKTTAKYIRTYSPGYQLSSDALSITYANKETTQTLATLSNINNSEGSDTALKSMVVTAPEDTNDGVGVIQLATDLFGTKAITLGKNDNYKFAFADEKDEAKLEDPAWAIKTTKKKGEDVPTGVVTWQQNYNDGYTISTNGKTATPAPTTATVLATVSGLNKDGLAEATSESLAVDMAVVTSTETVNGVTQPSTITISNPALLPTSGKVTLGKKDNYTFAFDKTTTDEDEAKEKILVSTTFTTPRWYVKSGTATYKTGTTAGYKIAESDGKSISKVNETAGAALLTISGLNKKAVASSDGTSVGLTTKEDTDGDGVKEDVYTQGLYLTNSDKIVLNANVVGTSTIKVENASDYKYEISENLSGYDKSTTDATKWNINKGTATYAASTTAGFVLSDLEDGKQTLTYKKAGNETVATITGLSKTYEGYIDAIIQINGDNIVLPAAVLGTTNATLKLPKGNTANYTLDLAADVPTATNRVSEWKNVTEWVTSGTTATYKNYDKAYYTINNKGVIVYNKPTTGTTYATLKGIKSGVDINDFVNKDTNVIPLTDQGDDAALAKSTVTLSNTSGYDFKLALLTTGNNKASTPTLGIDEEGGTYEDKAVWTKVTKNGGTASLKTKITAGFTATSDLKLTYSKAATPVVAKVTGMAIADEKDFTLRDEDGVENRTIELAGSDLYSQKIGVESAYGFAFSFDDLPSANTAKIYETATINGSAAADTISVGGESWAVNTGKGDDVVTVTGSGISVTGGVGNDYVEFSGTREEDDGNYFIYANKDGDDVIKGFGEYDTLKVTNVALTSDNIKTSSGDVVVTVGTGSITLKDASSILSSINIIDKSGKPVTTTTDSSSLLEDENYSMDAAALSDIVQTTDASYTPGNLEVNYGLTQEDKSAPAITYNTDDK